MKGAFISRLDFTTNFGRKYSVGNDYPVDNTDYGENLLSDDVSFDPNQFEVFIPYGSKVVSFHGSFNSNLLSIAAYYD